MTSDDLAMRAGDVLARYWVAPAELDPRSREQCRQLDAALGPGVDRTNASAVLVALQLAIRAKPHLGEFVRRMRGRSTDSMPFVAQLAGAIGESLRTQPRPDARATAFPVREILFLAADPRDAPHLRMGKERATIQEVMRQSRHRDAYALHDWPSTRVKDLIREMVRVRPWCLHFSGHGDEEGRLCLEDDYGRLLAVETEVIDRIFGEVQRVHCVVLNACYSREQASAIARHADWVVGSRGEILDRDALAFAEVFYGSLFEGCVVPQAYRLACAQLAARGLPEADMPVLYARD